MKAPALLVGVVLVTASAVSAGQDLSSEQALPRVQHHVREVETISRHFDNVLQTECRRFPTADEWRAYFDGEIDQMVLMMAHLEQAWVEAKRTGDDDVRRIAKAPRRRPDDARALVGKLQECASIHGVSFPPMQVWRRIEREVPRRQTEITLPEAPTGASPAITPVSQ